MEAAETREEIDDPDKGEEQEHTVDIFDSSVGAAAIMDDPVLDFVSMAVAHFHY